MMTVSDKFNMAQKKKTEKPSGIKINFEQVLCNLKNVPLSIDNEIVTLKYAAVAALMSQHSDEGNIPGVEKFSRYALAKRIHDGPVELSSDEITKIKTLIGKHFTTIIVGPAFNMLDGQVGVPPAVLTDETKGQEPNAEIG